MSDGLILPWREYFPATAGQDDGVTPVFRNIFGIVYGATIVPTPDRIVGSNIDTLVLTYPNSGAFYYYFQHKLPTDFYPAGGLKARALWTTPATAGNVRWEFYSAYAVPIDNDQDDLDPAFNSLVAVVTPAASNANRLIVSEGDLDLTGARADAMLMFSLGRDSGDVLDTLADDANLIGIELIYQRRIVLP